MAKYIIISLIMGLIITAWRVIRMAKFDNDYKIVNWDGALMAGLAVGYAINIVLWPISLVRELYDIGRGW